jgi:hypothetical protein
VAHAHSLWIAQPPRNAAPVFRTIVACYESHHESRQKILLWVLIALPIIYVGPWWRCITASARCSIPFHGAAHVATSSGIPQAEEHTLTTADGEKVIVWHVPPKPGRPVVVFFHGNGDILAWRVPRFVALTSDGTGLSRSRFADMPDRAVRHLSAVYCWMVPRRMSLRSSATRSIALCCGAFARQRRCVALAAENPIGRLILEAPYTSTSDIVASMIPFMPVSLLMKDQFPSDQRIAKVTAPLLVMHGVRDFAISIKFGERLYVLAPGPKRLVRFPEGGHENLDDFGAISTVRAFLPTPIDEFKMRRPEQ